MVLFTVSLLKSYKLSCIIFYESKNKFICIRNGACYKLPHKLSGFIRVIFLLLFSLIYNIKQYFLLLVVIAIKRKLNLLSLC